jgi:hypothetical protein
MIDVNSLWMTTYGGSAIPLRSDPSVPYGKFKIVGPNIHAHPTHYVVLSIASTAMEHDCPIVVNSATSAAVAADWLMDRVRDIPRVPTETLTEEELVMIVETFWRKS